MILPNNWKYCGLHSFAGTLTESSECEECLKLNMTDPVKPSLALLSKIGSIVVHADETLSSDGRRLDKDVVLRLINDPEVQEWIKRMGAYLPHKSIGKYRKPQ